MNYETYRLIDDLFVPASGAKDALESAIASHERLRNHLNSAYEGGGQNHVVTPIISAIDRVIQRYKIAIQSVINITSSSFLLTAWSALKPLIATI